MARTIALAVLLVEVLLSSRVLAQPPAALPAASAEQVQQAVDRAAKYLRAESASWLSTRKCAACHHAPLPLWALSEAERQGYAVDTQFVNDTIESFLGSHEKLLASRIFPNPADPPDPRPQGRGLNMGLPMLVVAAQTRLSITDGQRQSLRSVMDEIITKQQADGSWEFFATLRRPPINESQLTDVAWIIMAMSDPSSPDVPAEQRQALERAQAWFDATPSTELHQEKVLKLLIGLRRGQSRAQLQAAIDQLLALQRPDGGWSQSVPDWPSDSFATGQTLYVLSLLGYTAEQAEIHRGIDFLVATQLPDGSWPMRSRSTPDGSPGSSKLLTPINCAAASWATLGLVRLAPSGK